MSNFIINGIYSLYNSVCQRFWPIGSLKRRWDSADEDEEDDIIAGCQTLSKRPKWTTNPEMASNSDAPHCSSQRKSYSHLKMKIQKNVPLKRRNSATKENGNDVEVIEIEDSRNVQPKHKNSATKENRNDIEVIEIEDSDHQVMESRAPLTNLSVKTKTKCGPTTVPYSVNGISAPNRPDHKSSVHNTDTRKNGVHPLLFQNSFTTPMRFSKFSSASKQTALNETLKVDDQRKYSALLAEYHRSAQLEKCKKGDSHLPKQNWPLQSSLKTMTPLFSKSDSLAPRQEVKKSTRVPVKPWQSSVSDDDVEIIEERSAPCVNSLEKKLSQNKLVSPEWILEMQKKYIEREREAKRQVEEAKLKKELYAQHNQSKRFEALNERIRKHLQITDVVLDDVQEVTKLPELTPEFTKKINDALKPNPSTEVLVEGFGQLIRRLDIKTLHHLNWLNDEVINFYMNLIIERGKEGKYPKVYSFNTFFYPKLVSQGYNSLRRWTKKVDIFDHELLLVPIHLGMHWCMAAIDFRDCSVRYFDSMGSENNRCLNALLKYLNEESLDKKKKAYDISNWKLENVKGIPQQMNGSDCGVFSCMFAEYLSRNAKFTFSQKDMPYFRLKMVYEIVTKQLLQ